MASTTKSASDADEFSVEVLIREMANSASFSAILPFETSLFRDFFIVSIPLSTNSCLMSIIVTLYPAQAET